MIRRLLVCSLLLLSIYCEAQRSFTTVTFTLVDSSAQTWANATVIATLRPAPNNPFLPLNNGLAINDSPQTVVTDGSGVGSLVLDDTSHITPAGATWIFNIYPNATVQNGSSILLPVTGTSQNFSGILSSILIPPSVFAAPSINRAYNDSQVNGGTGGIYWNTTNNTIKGCVLSGGICNWITIGSIGVPGLHFYIPYNNGGGSFTASANLQFDDTTNTFSTVNANISGLLSPTNIGGNIGGLPTLLAKWNFSGGLKGTIASLNKYQTNLPSSPTCSLDLGGGTSPSCSTLSGSSDSSGVLVLQTGTGTPLSSGRATITFNSSFTSINEANCIFGIGSPNTGSWDNVIFRQRTPTLSSVSFDWANNGVNLNTSSSYNVNYFCWGN